jgi:hypothetical protein
MRQTRDRQRPLVQEAPRRRGPLPDAGVRPSTPPVGAAATAAESTTAAAGNPSKSAARARTATGNVACPGSKPQAGVAAEAGAKRVAASGSALVLGVAGGKSRRSKGSSSANASSASQSSDPALVPTRPKGSCDMDRYKSPARGHACVGTTHEYSYAAFPSCTAQESSQRRQRKTKRQT